MVEFKKFCDKKIKLMSEEEVKKLESGMLIERFGSTIEILSVNDLRVNIKYLDSGYRSTHIIGELWTKLWWKDAKIIYWYNIKNFIQ